MGTHRLRVASSLRLASDGSEIIIRLSPRDPGRPTDTEEAPLHGSQAVEVQNQGRIGIGDGVLQLPPRGLLGRQADPHLGSLDSFRHGHPQKIGVREFLNLYTYK